MVTSESCPKVIYRTYQIADICGNTNEFTQKITIDDNTPPDIVCPPDTVVECYSDIPPQLTTFASFISAGGSVTDNCGYREETFRFVGENMSNTRPLIISRTYSIEDSCRNLGQCTRTITVLDSIPPVAICNSIEVTLDSSGHLALSKVELETIGTGSFDNCTPFYDLAFELEPNEVDCSNVGVPVGVTLTVTDEVGNVSTCNTNVLVYDHTSPVALCRDTTVYLDENGQVSITKEMIDNGSYDNCGINSMFLDKYNFDCSNVGQNPVTLYVVDNSANMDKCTATVTVLDTVPPEAVCHDITLYLDPATNRAEIDSSYIDGGSTDACGIQTIKLDQTVFDCDNLGNNTVTMTVTDVNGNVSECQANVYIPDKYPPFAFDDRYRTYYNTDITFNVLQNDKSGTTAISDMEILNQPTHGSIDIRSQMGTLTYTPDPGYHGMDTLFYMISDNGRPCQFKYDSAYVYIFVSGPNQPPVAVNDTFDIVCEPLNANFIENDYDPDGDALNANTIPITQPANGIVTIYDDGSFNYQPNDGYTGIDSFKYEICDVVPVPLCDSATVFINVQNDNCDSIPVNGCELFVPEGFSPNGDGIHDYFEVYCMEQYKYAVMYIFDRDGHLLFKKDHYGNLDYWGTDDRAWWDGTSNSRWNRGGGLVLPGNYLYVLVLGDGHQEKGTVMVSYH